MNVNLSPDSIKEVKTYFDSYCEILDRASELAQEKKAILERAAAIYEVKTGKVSKMFSNLKKRMEVGENEIQDIMHMEDAISISSGEE